MKRVCQYLLVLSLALLGFLPVAAQELIEVKGTVRDYSTGRRMKAVSVSTGNKQASTVTNEDGEFLIKIPYDQGSLIFTHLGYQTLRMPIDDPAREMKVRMRPETIHLSEIVVESPEDILRTAIERVPVNYPSKADLSYCFYRETTQKGHRFIYVAEAVTQMYKTPYKQSVYHDDVSIVKGRRLVSPKQTDTLGAKVQGGPTLPIFMDVAKNRDYVLSVSEMEKYSFKMELPERIDGRPQIVISFKPKIVTDEALYIGKYYIDKATLSITRLDMHLDMSDKEKATRFMLYRKPMGVRFKPYGLEVLVDYQTTDSVTRMSYVRTRSRFKCDWKRKLFSAPYVVSTEMVVTSRDTTQTRPPKGRHSFSPRDSYYDHREYFLDESFWGDYNIIAPTENLNDAIDKLMKKTAKS
jgi:hypothetical protein